MITLKDITPEQYSTYVGVLTIEDKDSLIGQLGERFAAYPVRS